MSGRYFFMPVRDKRNSFLIKGKNSFINIAKQLESTDSVSFYDHREELI
jgi:hypothetical protein